MVSIKAAIYVYVFTLLNVIFFLLNVFVMRLYVLRLHRGCNNNNVKL